MKIYEVRIAIIMLLIGFTFIGCKQAKVERTAQRLDLSGAATGVYFTRDQNDVPVLCWTEQMGADSLYYLRYARYEAASDGFAQAITVPGSVGSSISAESMGKIAFKADGTVMAMFGKRFPQEKNPYASAIYYSLSADQGKTWSPSRFIHSDTAHHYGRSFFDLSLLSDGELAAVWLDGRYGKRIKGSALFFAKTEKGGGFTTDVCVQKGTCECCRTNIVTDKIGKIHIAYRSIMYPNVFLGAQVRDMAYLISEDQGKTFSHPKTISEDNWEIDGCPHSGPSMAINRQGVNALWFTAGGKPGLYFSNKNADQTFQKRVLLSENGRHPQMTTLKDEKLALVFEESQDKPAEAHGAQGAHGHAQASSSKIVLCILKNGKTEKQTAMSDGDFSDHHAVVTPLNDGLILAWIREEQGESTLYYRSVANL